MRRLSLLIFCTAVTSAHACSDLLARLATHLDLTSVSRAHAHSLEQYGFLLETVLSDDPDLKRGLSALLALDPATARQISLAFVAYDIELRAALLQRLRWLSEWGSETQTRQFLLAIPKLREPLPDPRNLNHPELLRWRTQASAYLQEAPQSALDHIVGEQTLTPTGPVRSGGGHTLRSWEALAEKRMDSWPTADRQAFEAYVDTIDISGSGYTYFLDFLKEHGFETSRRGWAKHLVSEQNLWGVEKRANEVLCLWLPRSVFNAKAWKATVQAARYGKAPIGGKSIFPVSWSLEHIRKATVALLQDPQTRLLTEGISQANPSYYMRGTHRGIVLDVGLVANRVQTVFPAWRQQLPKTGAAAYLEWWAAYASSQTLASRINLAEYAANDLRSSVPLALLYLGLPVAGLSKSDHSALDKWLNPKHLPVLEDPTRARSYQSVVFHWLSRERVVRTLEGAAGPLFQP